MLALKQGDRDGLMALEAKQRELAKMPPYGRLAALILEGEHDAEVRAMATALAQQAPQLQGVRVLGPAPAPLARLRRQFRYRFLVHAEKQTHLQQIMRDWIAIAPNSRKVRLKVDIDPYSFV